MPQELDIKGTHVSFGTSSTLLSFLIVFSSHIHSFSFILYCAKTMPPRTRRSQAKAAADTRYERIPLNTVQIQISGRDAASYVRRTRHLLPIIYKVG